MQSAENDIRLGDQLVNRRAPPRQIPREEVVRVERLRIILADEDMALIMRYSGQLHRQIIQSLHELEAMQARRRGERTPLARLDIIGAPGGENFNPRRPAIKL